MDVLQSVVSASGGKVISGPFRSMIIDHHAKSWGDGGDVIRKLLGVYEEELHDCFETLIAKAPRRIINIGCAEGYYAVGMAMRVPTARVFAVDICPRAQNCTAINAAANEVKITVCASAPDPKPEDLWVVDIEGGEVALLAEPAKWKNVDIVVELHEWLDRRMKDNFEANFSATHKVVTIVQGARNPNKFEFLAHFPDDVRWQIMSESRMEFTRWLWLQPKTDNTVLDAPCPYFLFCGNPISVC